MRQRRGGEFGLAKTKFGFSWSPSVCSGGNSPAAIFAIFGRYRHRVPRPIQRRGERRERTDPVGLRHTGGAGSSEAAAVVGNLSLPDLRHVNRTKLITGAITKLHGRRPQIRL